MITTTEALSGFVPEADLFNLSFLFNNSERMYKMREVQGDDTRLMAVGEPP